MPLRLLSATLYEGPSLHADRAAVMLRVDFGALVDVTLGERPALVAFLNAKLGADPSIDPASWAKLPLPAVAARLAAALQQHAGHPTELVVAHPSGEAGIADIVLGYRIAVIGANAARAALAWIEAGVGPGAAGDGMSLAGFAAAVAPWQLSNIACRVIEVAERRGIPWFRVHPALKMIELGHGRHRWRFDNMISGATPVLSWEIAKRKDVAIELLRQAGLPVTSHRLVGDWPGALAAARQLGYPVVVKPCAMDQGIGVRLFIEDDAGLAEAYAEAQVHGPVLVERQIVGVDYRLLVIHGRFAAAVRKRRAEVTGDGTSTVAALIARVNADPRRGDDPSWPLVKLFIDDEMRRCLARQNSGLDQVPGTGAVLRLRELPLHARGATIEEASAEIHPANRLLAERAARLAGLDIAGIDFVTPDIARPWQEVGGGICEVNPMPGMMPHLSTPGAPDVLGMLLDGVFPPGTDGRIPLAAIAGSDDATAICRVVAAMLEAAGHVVGLATREGVSIGGTPVVAAALAGPTGAKMVLRDATVTAAVLETGPGDIVNYGLGFDRCHVGAVPGIAGDPPGIAGVETPADRARVNTVLMRCATEMTVLDADDPHCRDLAPTSRARLCWVTRGAPDGPLRAHIAAGRPAVSLADRPAGPEILLWEAGEAVPITAIAARRGGGAPANTANVLFAVAIGRGLGLAPAIMAAALNDVAGDRE